MPAIRSAQDLAKFKVKVQSNAVRRNATMASTTSSNSQLLSEGQSHPEIWFPTAEHDRSRFKTSSGKSITPHEWAVYDLCFRIPYGKVTTYKSVCEMLGAGSPRSVGSALRKNPFAPYVPCHRVIASDLSLGGFKGEWGTENQEGSTCADKVDILRQEGVTFDNRGKLEGGRASLWRCN